MLPIALTCPLWWVARWMGRVLASLAVVVACSLGAATLPVAPDATARPAPRASDSSDASALRAPDPGSAVVGQARSAVIRWSHRADAVGRARAEAGPAARADSGTTDLGSVDRLVVASGVPAPMPPRRAMVVPPDRHRGVSGRIPATVGSRAPPVR